MSDFLIAGLLQFAGLVATVIFLLALFSGAEVRREHEWMSREWMRGKR